MDDNEEHEQNSTASQTKAIIGDLDVLCRKDRCTNFLSAQSRRATILSAVRSSSCLCLLLSRVPFLFFL